MSKFSVFSLNFLWNTFSFFIKFQIFNFDPAFNAEIPILRTYTEAYIAEEMTLEEALAGAQADMELQIGNPWEQ